VYKLLYFDVDREHEPIGHGACFYDQSWVLGVPQLQLDVRRPDGLSAPDGFTANRIDDGFRGTGALTVV